MRASYDSFEKSQSETILSNGSDDMYGWRDYRLHNNHTTKHTVVKTRKTLNAITRPENHFGYTQKLFESKK